jgi:hypothetical protein
VIQTLAGFHVFLAVERAVRPLSPDALLGAQARALESWLAQRQDESEIVRLVS